MDTKALMEKMFGTGAPYPGMEVTWECFAGVGAIESGIYQGAIAEIRWCQHCHLPTITAKSDNGAEFSIRITSNGKYVCGSEAPE